MKRIMSILITILFFIGVSIYLYKTGKGYTVFVTNNPIEGIAPIKEIVVDIDNVKKPLKVKKGKKAYTEVRGIVQKFVLTYKENGEEKKFEGEFKNATGKETILDLTKFIAGDKDWVSYEDIVQEEVAPEDETAEVKTEM